MLCDCSLVRVRREDYLLKSQTTLRHKADHGGILRPRSMPMAPQPRAAVVADKSHTLPDAKAILIPAPDRANLPDSSRSVWDYRFQDQRSSGSSFNACAASLNRLMMRLRAA